METAPHHHLERPTATGNFHATRAALRLVGGSSFESKQEEAPKELEDELREQGFDGTHTIVRDNPEAQGYIRVINGNGRTIAYAMQFGVAWSLMFGINGAEATPHTDTLPDPFDVVPVE